jgi:ubiquinone/menaquinone biosynthesis C-methylase UbiE
VSGRRFFSAPEMDAAMGAMLASTSEMLRLAVRQHRLEQALFPSADTLLTPLDDPVQPQERGWVGAKADDLVSAWLGPFAGEHYPAGGHGGQPGGTRGERPATGVRRAPRLEFAADVHYELIQAVRRYWSGALYRAVVRDAEAAQRAHADTGLDVAGLDQALRGSLAYQAFGWIERHAQIAKYTGANGLLSSASRQRDGIAAALDEAAASHPDRLVLDAGLTLPGYYAETDFHLVPGGIHSRCYDGVVYEWAAGSTTMMSNENADVHDSLAARIARTAPGADVLDVGCGFGRTIVALGRELPQARLTGADLSAPVLRLAHLRALEQGVTARFVQTDATSLTPFADASFDVVTATMLLHELPPPQVREFLRAARRVLRPGGQLVVLDFYLVPGGALGMFFHLGHADRNGEPFMPALLGLDLAAEARAAGFTEPAICGYPAGQPGDELPPRWRLPWTLIEAAREGAAA